MATDYQKFDHMAKDLSDSDDDTTKQHKAWRKTKGKVTTEPAHYMREEDFDAEYYSENEDDEYAAKDVSHLIQEEAALVVAQMVRCEQNRTTFGERLANKDFVLHLRFNSCRPAIWRHVRVPADISLDSLHDKVICPALGFCRNYHSYMFVEPGRPDKRVGFGRVGSRTVDAYNQRLLWGGEAMCDATQVLLYQLLCGEGRVLKYCYDFRCRWRVSVILDAVQDRVAGSRPVEIRGGSRSCPVEDAGPMIRFCQKLDHFVDAEHPSHAEAVRLFDAAPDAYLPGNAPPPAGYDPQRFTESVVQAALDAAWAAPASPMDGSFVAPGLGGSTLAAVAAAAASAAVAAGRGREGSKWGITLIRERRARDMAARTCALCQTLLDKGRMLKCSRCRAVVYCDRNCQAKHWKSHKTACAVAPAASTDSGPPQDTTSTTKSEAAPPDSAPGAGASSSRLEHAAAVGAAAAEHTLTSRMASVDIVHEVTSEVVDALAALIPQLSSEPSPSYKDLVDLVASQASTLIVARLDGRIVGSLVLVVYRTTISVYAVIEAVVVDAAARGNGIGECLCKFAVEEARRRGAKSVNLTSRPTREAANRLYVRLGFVQRDTNVYRYDLS